MIGRLLFLCLLVYAGTSIAETIDGSSAGERAIQGTHRAIKPAYQQRDSAPAQLREPQSTTDSGRHVNGHVQSSQTNDGDSAGQLDDEVERRREHMQNDTAN